MKASNTSYYGKEFCSKEKSFLVRRNTVVIEFVRTSMKDICNLKNIPNVDKVVS